MRAPFENVVDAHGERVLRVCRAVLGAHEDAEDAWSETFLSALRAWPALDADADVEAWIVTIAHRKAIDVIRARSRRAITVETLPDRVSDLGVPGSGDDELWGAVASLPDKQRLVVAYRYLTGMSYAEIAHIVGGSADAARRAGSDGVAALRRRLAAEHRQGEQEQPPASAVASRGTRAPRRRGAGGGS